MQRGKGYTDELEKINRDDSLLALMTNLKAAATSKLRYRITGWSQGKYWYSLSNRGYICLIRTIISPNRTHINK